ncbi:hypothetical protein [Urechidicola vernalis]|uniref:Tetratricopeptide repeat protein n=1 Tax=Urechidicola vernalis TaxID=3075600 RepID=A0ABU2Y5H7_9FLAO|nr:hypothetical protein [Urechidicola sp. P050]MDT0552313.1 hypothetical protein [Urechidicola sp. P050]
MNTKIATLAVSMLMTLSTIAQKNEIKAAEKALKKKDYATALTEISKADGLISNADDKSKAKYYYIKGMALYAEGSDTGNIDDVITSFNALKAAEEASGVSKYSIEVSGIITTIIEKINTESFAAYQAGLNGEMDKYGEAAVGYDKIYRLMPQDTSFLYNAALVNSVGKNHEMAISQYQELLDLGYTGITTIYTAKSTVNNEVLNYSSYGDMMGQVKLKIAKDPKTEITKSKYMDMIKAIGSNYLALDNNEKALEFIRQARAENPTDYNLIIEEGTIYFKMGDNQKYMEKLEEAVQIKPDEAELHYVIGTIILESEENLDKAKEHLEKAIELDPKHSNAYLNMGAVFFKELKPIEDEMNANATNFAKYDKIKAEKYDPILKKMLPFIEKAYGLNPSDDVKNQLNSIYETLGMEKRAE